MKQVLALFAVLFLVSCGSGNDKVSALMDQYSKTLNEFTQAVSNGNTDLQATLKKQLEDIGQKIASQQGNLNPEQSIKWLQLQADSALKGLQGMVKDVKIGQ